MKQNEPTAWRYTASSQEVVRSDGVLIARDVPPEFGSLVEAAPMLLKFARLFAKSTEWEIERLERIGGITQANINRETLKMINTAIARARP